MIFGLILAAGTSRRMGRPKALLEYRGKTFIENIVTTLRDAAIDGAIVAISPQDDKIKEFIDLTFAHIVYNHHTAENGQLSSIKAGLTEVINRSVEYVVIWPVDQPHIQVGTVTRLRDAVFASGRPIGVPVFRGKRGHPAFFGKAVFGELSAAPLELGAKVVVRRDPNRVLEVPVEDPAVIDDIDTPEDYERLISSTKSLL